MTQVEARSFWNGGLEGRIQVGANGVEKSGI